MKPLKSHKPRGSNNAQGRVRWRALFRVRWLEVKRSGDFSKVLKFLYTTELEPLYGKSSLLRLIRPNPEKTT